MRPFSLDRKGVAINLFNLKRERFISNAPVKSQCSKDYFYGEDGELEKLLSKLEGEYSNLVIRIESGVSLSPKDETLLRDFMFLQWRRTDVAATSIKVGSELVKDAVTQGGKFKYDGMNLSQKEALLISLRTFANGRKYIHDLKMVIGRNLTKTNFIASDDPAGFTNRFYSQRLKDNNYGVMNSGTIAFMPITSKLYAIAYDSKVYTVPDSSSGIIRITSDSDVRALNQLQYIRAAENIYFSDWNERGRIADCFQEVAERRLASRVSLRTFVPDGKDQNGERYRSTEDKEFEGATEGIISVGFNYPSPAIWLSKLKFRNSPKMYSNGSAVGFVRKREWLTREGRG